MTSLEKHLRLPGLIKIYEFKLQESTNSRGPAWFTHPSVDRSRACGVATSDPHLGALGYETLWDRFMSVMDFLSDVQIPLFHGGVGDHAYFLDAYSRKVQIGEREQLFSLLWSFRSIDSSNPRDKIFALLGLTDTSQSDLMIEPDYTISTEDLYLRLSSHLLPTAFLPYLMNISGVERAEGFLNIPSWVVDWRSNGLTREFLLSQFESAPYHRPADVLFSDDGKSTSLLGFMLDSVENLGEVFQNPLQGFRLLSWRTTIQRIEARTEWFKEAESISNTLSLNDYAPTGRR